jgi:hypothetical protein
MSPPRSPRPNATGTSSAVLALAYACPRLQAIHAGLGDAHAAHIAKLRQQQLADAARVPVVVIGATGASHEVDDHVLLPDLDRS